MLSYIARTFIPTVPNIASGRQPDHVGDTPSRGDKIIVRQDRDIYRLNAAGQKFSFRGRDYTVVQKDGGWVAKENASGYISAFFHGIADRFEGVYETQSLAGFVSHETRLTRLFSKPTYLHFRIDIDGTLWDKSSSQKEIDPQDLNYFKAVIARKGVATPVVVSKNLIDFLKVQQKLGAHVSILSTGATDLDPYTDAPGAVTVKQLLRRNGVELTSAQNKKDLDRISKSRETSTLSMGQKFGVHGQVDKANPHRRNIMIDNEFYHLTNWQHSINAKEFGMGDRLK